MTEEEEIVFMNAFGCIRVAIALFKLHLPNDESYLNQTMAYNPYIYEFIMMTYGKEIKI